MCDITEYKKNCIFLTIFTYDLIFCFATFVILPTYFAIINNDIQRFPNLVFVWRYQTHIFPLILQLVGSSLEEVEEGSSLDEVEEVSSLDEVEEGSALEEVVEA